MFHTGGIPVFHTRSHDRIPTINAFRVWVSAHRLPLPCLRCTDVHRSLPTPCTSPHRLFWPWSKLPANTALRQW